MPIGLKALAFLSGFILFAGITYVSGHLAAIAIPVSYFEYFGRQHRILALVIEEAFVIALPLFFLSVLWAYPWLRSMRAHRWKAALWCLAGLMIAQAILDVYLVRELMDVPLPEGGERVSLGTFVLGVIFPWDQPWAYLNVLAAPAGIVVAALMLGGGRRLRSGASSGSSAKMVSA